MIPPESRFQIIDKNTGEVVAEEDFLKEYFSDVRSDQKKGFEIAYPYKVFRFMEASDSPKTKVLIHLLKIKSSQNLISGTSRSIADDLGISKNTVHAVMKKLQDEKLILKVKQGTYLLDPDVMVYGGNNAWRAKDIWTKHFKK
jgi:biotin operon repressor